MQAIKSFSTLRVLRSPLLAKFPYQMPSPYPFFSHLPSFNFTSSTRNLKDDQNEDNDLLNAMMLVDTYDYRTAIKEFENILRSQEYTSPEALFEIHISLAISYVGLLEYTKALTQLSIAQKYSQGDDLLQKGRLLRLQARISHALEMDAKKLYDEALLAFTRDKESIEGLQEKAVLHSELGEFFLARNDMDQALEHLQKGDAIFQLKGITNDSLKHAKLYGRLSNYYYRKGHEKLGGDYMNRAFQLIKDYKESPGHHLVSAYLSKVFAYIKNHQRAYNLLSDSINGLSSKFGEESILIYYLKKDLADLMMAKSNPIAFSTYQYLLPQLKEFREHELLRTQVQKQLSQYYIKNNKYNEAIKSLREEIRLITKLFGSDSIKLMEPLYELGRLESRDNTEQAIENLKKVLALARLHNNTSETVIMTRTELGSIYADAMNYALSQNHLKEALILLDKRDYPHENVLCRQIYYIQAANYRNQKNFQQALITLEKICTLEEQNPELLKVENIYYQMGVLQIKLQNFEEALESLQKAITMAERHTSLYEGLGVIYSDIASLLKERKSYESSLDYFRSAIDFYSDKDSDRELLPDLYHETGEVLQKLGKLKEAKLYFQKAVQL